MTGDDGVHIRYSVEKIPVYDSAEDEPPSKVLRNLNSENSGNKFNVKTEHSMDLIIKPEQLSESTAFNIQPRDSVPVEGLHVNSIKTEIGSEDMKLYSRDTQQAFPQNNAMVSRIRSNTAGRNYRIGPGSMPTKRSKTYNGRFKNIIQKQVDVKSAAESLASKEAQEEILRYEEVKNEATSALDTLYNEIRPAIEEHERDSQDSVSTSVAEKWIGACCLKLKAEFDLYSSIVKNIACTPPRPRGQPNSQVDHGNDIKLLTD
ncbi:histone-lysine N-methyltransferase ASHH1 [Senna tora]|uniref:Histone-lysine N-methyltransferase ASHH1 n=1 Tax=Senna tora TaxID=362788 RepID=A0A834W8H4_9FABA|nr:histone-lysine N-methyltransferase ASHH1 [Senna tora]